MKGPTCTHKANQVQACPNMSIATLNNSINTYSNANTNQVIQPYLNQLRKSNKPAGKKQSSMYLGKFNKAIFVTCKLHLPYIGKSKVQLWYNILLDT